MSSRKQRGGRGPARARTGRRWAVSLAIVLSIVGAGAWMWLAASPATSGTPRLEASRTEIDFGDLRFEEWVTATFELRNTGDGTLTLRGVPSVRVTEGC